VVFRRPFLTAQWLNLALLTYRLKPEMLQLFVPPGCTLDLIDGYAFASLVAFDFVGTRVLGIAWPGFVNFPEVNLRFYVRHRDEQGDHRGVCFIREIVAQRTIALLANRLYNEPYVVAPMHSRVEKNNTTIMVHHQVTMGGRANALAVTAETNTICPAPDSMECFFKEHQWGYGTSRSKKLIRYRVNHRIWNIHPVLSHQLDWDWKAVYGPNWAHMQDVQPMSVILAEGSAVEVFPYGTL
jgi:uncharacterized protein YqjF (DUF2071 family)